MSSGRALILKSDVSFKVYCKIEISIILAITFLNSQKSLVPIRRVVATFRRRRIYQALAKSPEFDSR